MNKCRRPRKAGAKALDLARCDRGRWHLLREVAAGQIVSCAVMRVTFFGANVAASVAQAAPLHGRARRTPHQRSLSTGRFSLRVTVPCACCSCRGASVERISAGGTHRDVIPRRARHRWWQSALGRAGRGASGKHPPAGGAHCGIIVQHRMRHRIVALGRSFERLPWLRLVAMVARVGPNRAFERTRRFSASAWPLSTRRAAQLGRWGACAFDDRRHAVAVCGC